MNIFKEMALSVYSYGSYRQFLQNRKGKVFGFAATLMAIYFVVTLLIPSFVTIVSPNGIVREIMDSIPDFKLKDGILWVDGVYEYDEGGNYLYVDTDPDYVFYDADEIEPYFRDYSTVILLDAEKIFVKSDGQIQGLYYSDLGSDVEFSKKDLRGLAPWAYVFYVMFMIFSYIWMSALFFFGVLFVALLGMAVASGLKYQLTFGQLYLLGIYSRTLPLIIKAVVHFLPFNIPYFWVINFGLSVLILFLAIRKMKEEQPPQQFMGYDNPMGPYMNGR